MQYLFKNQSELEEFGRKIARTLKGNELIALSGNLGAGKTTLTKAIGKELKVKEDIISPTFNILKVYDSIKGAIYHIDAYRLESIGYDPVLDDYLFDDNAIKIVEWYEFLNDDELFKDAIKINIKAVGVNEREVEVNGLCID